MFKNLFRKKKSKKNKKNITTKNLYSKLLSIENNIENLNSLLSEKDKKIFALQREIEDFKSNENKIINKLFKSIDSMDEIRLFCKKTNKLDMLDSVSRSINILKNDLRDLGIEEIPTVGELFNSNVHECMQSVSMDSKEQGEIIEVIRRGYYFNGKVIRTALVITAQ